MSNARTAARRAVLPGLVAAVVLLVALPGAYFGRQLTLERRATADEAALGTVAGGLGRDLERLVELAAVAGRAGPAGSARLGASPGVMSAGFVPAAERPAAPGSMPMISAEVLDDLDAVMARARDTGEAQLGPVVDTEAGPALPLLAPHYRGSDAEPPRTRVERRDRVAGWVVALIDPGAVAAPHVLPGTVAQVADGVVAFPATTGAEAGPGTGAASVPARLPSVDIDVRGHRFTITAGDPRATPVAARTVLLAAGGVALAALGAVGAAVALRRDERQRDAAEHLQAQVDLIGEVAPTVQQSLDLSDVLPSVAVQLCDHFGLVGVRVSTSVVGSSRSDLFGIGARPDPAAVPQLQPPEHLVAGETACLALQRGGRTVAVLSLVAGRDLGAVELRSLRALVELVTAAIVNAALFASQQEALRELRELDALKTVFLGTASHELRTPATTITGFASLLAGSWDDLGEEQRRTFAGRIEANARSLSAVVQDLLDFSLLDRGRLALAIAPVDLGALVESVVDRLGSAMPDHEVVVQVHAVDPVAGDANGIERIVTNLLTNAVKYSPSGTTITIDVGPADSGDGAVLAVSDEGPGVPEDEREKIFTRFFRGTGETVVQTRGVGIGLSVVAELVERMHGDVQITDAPGGGARFTVWLPPATSAGVEGKEVEDAAAR